MTLHVFDVLDRGWVRNLEGERLPIQGSVSREEAHVLHDLVVKNQARRGIETGIARGISTLALAEAFSQTKGSLVGFDPFQDAHHGDSAIETLREFSLESTFELRREPAQSGMGTLESTPPFDFVFIDDVHNFHYRLVTFFQADNLVEPGGIVAFHDLWLPSMKKLLRFVNTLGSYEIIPTPIARPCAKVRLRRLLGASMKLKPYWYWWPNGFSNLLVLRKISEGPSDFLWFKNF